jgi:hypothetical protein
VGRGFSLLVAGYTALILPGGAVVVVVVKARLTRIFTRIDLRVSRDRGGSRARCFAARMTGIPGWYGERALENTCALLRHFSSTILNRLCNNRLDFKRGVGFGVFASAGRGQTVWAEP